MLIRFLEELKVRNEMLFYFGLLCILATLICIVLIAVTNIQVLGTNAYFKPLKFFLSTAIFVWSMGWYGHYLQEQQVFRYYSIALIVLFTIEDLYIFIQATRGQTSHFNLQSDFENFMWGVMVVSAMAISIWTLIVTVRFFTTPLVGLPDYYAWSIRLALVIFVIFSLEGMAMGARMAHTIHAADGSSGLPIVNWSKAYGDLRVAHFLGMHALQIIPLMSFYIIKDLRTIIALSIAYFLFTSFTFIQALMGRSIMESFRF